VWGIPACAQTNQDFAARLAALEQENKELRVRLNRLEHAKLHPPRAAEAPKVNTTSPQRIDALALQSSAASVPRFDGLYIGAFGGRASKDKQALNNYYFSSPGVGDLGGKFVGGFIGYNATSGSLLGGAEL
jgi:hypothetical protein